MNLDPLTVFYLAGTILLLFIIFIGFIGYPTFGKKDKSKK